jgi:uncharacterized membrane protein
MQRISETNRIEAFSDGVFAISATLLILEIKIPNQLMVNTTGLMIALIKLWPSYLAYVTSFITILVFWTHHHWIFSLMQRSDHSLVYWNGILLLVITFIPFPTGLLAEYLLHPQSKIAASIYTGNFLLVSLAFHGLWRHISKQKRLLSTEASLVEENSYDRISKHYRLGPACYLIAFLTSFVSEVLSVSLCLIIAIFFAIRAWPLETSTANTRK